MYAKEEEEEEEKGKHNEVAPQHTLLQVAPLDRDLRAVAINCVGPWAEEALVSRAASNLGKESGSNVVKWHRTDFCLRPHAKVGEPPTNDSLRFF